MMTTKLFYFVQEQQDDCPYKALTETDVFVVEHLPENLNLIKLVCSIKKHTLKFL